MIIPVSFGALSETVKWDILLFLLNYVQTTYPLNDFIEIFSICYQINAPIPNLLLMV
jgi:hypothetical protein